MTDQCELMRSTRLSEAQKKRLIVALTAGPWRKDMTTDLPPPARVSELIDTISSEQYLVGA
jgi:hypothetical protein